MSGNTFCVYKINPLLFVRWVFMNTISHFHVCCSHFSLLFILASSMRTYTALHCTQQRNVLKHHGVYVFAVVVVVVFYYDVSLSLSLSHHDNKIYSMHTQNTNIHSTCIELDEWRFLCRCCCCCILKSIPSSIPLTPTKIIISHNYKFHLKSSEFNYY